MLHRLPIGLLYWRRTSAEGTGQDTMPSFPAQHYVAHVSTLRCPVKSTAL